MHTLICLMCVKYLLVKMMCSFSLLSPARFMYYANRFLLRGQWCKQLVTRCMVVQRTMILLAVFKYFDTHSLSNWQFRVSLICIKDLLYVFMCPLHH